MRPNFQGFRRFSTDLGKEAKRRGREEEGNWGKVEVGKRVSGGVWKPGCREAGKQASGKWTNGEAGKCESGEAEKRGSSKAGKRRSGEAGKWRSEKVEKWESRKVGKWVRKRQSKEQAIH